MATGETYAESGVSLKLFDGGWAKSWGFNLNPKLFAQPASNSLFNPPNPRQFKHWLSGLLYTNEHPFGDML